MLELFRIEAENQTAILSAGLLELEHGSAAAAQLEALMRAAHSLKGAARIVNLPVAVRVAHAMEDCFVAAQRGKVQLRQAEIDALLRGVDLLLNISKHSEADIAAWETGHAAVIQEFLASLAALIPQSKTAQPAVFPPEPPPSAGATGGTPAQNEPAAPAPVIPAGGTTPAESSPAPPDAAQKIEAPERVLRLTAENLNRLLSLAGEALVESRWLRPFSDSMQRLKRLQSDLERAVDGLRQTLDEERLSERAAAQLSALSQRMTESRQGLADRLQELDSFDRRSTQLSNRLYLEVLRARMRPFGDAAHRFPRMMRDLARSLGKEVRLEIIGENTQVDRDILERLETPLAHLLRNAVDHGCEPPEERQRAGKPPAEIIRLEAHHSAGMLLVTVSDDGAGIDTQKLRRTIVQKKLVTTPAAEKLSDPELLEFLFRPGFTMKETVTEISGRGVGLDIVLSMVKSVRGTVRVSTQPGRGTRFQLQLPLTLSVLRTLLVEVAGEPYAFPLAQISRTLKLPRERIEALEGRCHFRQGDQQIGLLTAHQMFDCGEPQLPGNELPVVVLGDRTTHCGLVVDRFLGERELVVLPLDSRLGKVRNISAAALMEDGSPVLIVDMEDLVRSIEKLITTGTLVNVAREAIDLPAKRLKRILVVDDSLAVRELERKLLRSHGYLADTAADGADGWSAVRAGAYDLVITDVDMPRMDGIELATRIKQDPHLKTLPVMIVTCKDREEDRRRGLEAGADFYLPKAGFDDEALLQTVVKLIGEPGDLNRTDANTVAP